MAEEAFEVVVVPGEVQLGQHVARRVAEEAPRADDVVERGSGGVVRDVVREPERLRLCELPQPEVIVYTVDDVRPTHLPVAPVAAVQEDGHQREGVDPRVELAQPNHVVEHLLLRTDLE